MKILLLSILITAVSADSYCKGLYIKDDYYTVDIIKNGINRIHNLAYNKNDNSAYFIFEDIAKVTTSYLGFVTFEPPRISGVVDGTKNAKAVIVDQNLNKIYIGGSEGLYVIDKNNNRTAKLAVNEDIINLFLKGDLYFVTDKKEAFKYDFNTVIRVPELKNESVDKFVISNNNNILFLKGSKVFRVKIGETQVVPVGNYDVYDIATNYQFKPYITTKEGVFEYNSKTNVFDKISELNNLKKLAFAYDKEPIYAVVDTIVKLVHNDVPCFGD